MPINAGELNQRIRLEHFVATGADGYGKPVGAWQTLCERFAKVTINGASETTSQQQKTAVRTATAVIRTLTAATEKLRFVWRGRTFHVTGVVDVPSEGGGAIDLQELTATEEV